jgi:competence protein ComEC
MPDVVHTTKTFEDVLDAISEKGLKITKAIAGNTYSLGTTSFTIVAPNGSDYDELNDYSVGIKFINGENSFLLTGDAEKISETEMLHNGIDLSADVLKLGHHGSSTSSQEDFLDEVQPDYAVISAGIDNSYGHPHVETLQKLKDRNIEVFRTDLQDTIIFTSDGEHITVNKEPYSITQSDLSRTTKNNSTNSARDKSKNSGSTIVHITNTGLKYHATGCRFLKVDIEVTLDEALAKGLEPCGTCKPPTK